MGGPRKDEQPTLVQGYVWAARASTIALQAVLPAGLGYWLDQRWNTAPWLLIVGAVIGFAAMMSELMALTKSRPRSKKADSPPDSSKS